MKTALLALSIALVCVPVAAARPAASKPTFPLHGVLHLGDNLAGVRIGDTNARVREL